MKVKAVATYKVLQKRYTYQDYLDLPADGKRCEIINGELLIVPAPFTIHQKVTVKLGYQLLKYLENEKSGELFHAPFDVMLNENNVVRQIFSFSPEKMPRLLPMEISKARQILSLKLFPQPRLIILLPD